MRMLGLGLVAVLATALVPATPAGVEAAQKAQKDRAATMTAIALAESRKKKGLKARAKPPHAKDLGSWGKADGLDVTWEAPAAKKKQPTSKTLCAPVGSSKPGARC